MSALAPKADIRQLRVNSDFSLGTTAEIVGYTAGAVVLHRQRPKADTGHRSQCVRIPESAAERLEKKLMPWTADDAERHTKKADSPNLSACGQKSPIRYWLKRETKAALFARKSVRPL